VLQIYENLGPTARLCFYYSDDELADFRRSRDSEINKTSDLSSTRSLFQQLLEQGDQLSMDSLSHKICLIRRSVQRDVHNPNFTVSPISESVANMLISRLENLSESDLLGMWRQFSVFGDARGMTGLVFEAYVHQRFRREISFEASPMVRGPRSKSSWHASFSLKIPVSATSSAQSIPKTTICDHETVVYYQGPVKLKVKTGTYYVPRSRQQVALDSFVVHGGILYIFQCTGGRKHPIRDGMVPFLNSCEGIPSVDQWRFVFVVPDDLDSFSCPASDNELIHGLNPYTARIPMSA